MTLFGTSVDAIKGEAWADAIKRVTTQLQPAVVRVYQDTPSAPGLSSILRTGASVALSFKVWNDKAVDALLDGLPSDRVSFVGFYHEPEDNIESGGLSLARWIDHNIALCQAIVDKGLVGRVRPFIALISWSLAPFAKRDLSTYATPELVAALKRAKGIWGWDAYAGKVDKPPRALQDVYGVCEAFSTKLGLPWGIFETGIAMNSNTNHAIVADYWRRCFQWLGTEVTPPEVFLLWNADSKKDPSISYRVDDFPVLTKVWATACLPTSTPPDPIPDPPPTDPPAVDPLQAQVDSLTAQVADLTAQLTTLTGQNTDLTAQLTAAHEYGTELETQVHDLGTKLAAAQADVDTANNAATSLHAALDDAHEALQAADAKATDQANHLIQVRTSIAAALTDTTTTVAKILVAAPVRGKAVHVALNAVALKISTLLT